MGRAWNWSLSIRFLIFWSFIALKWLVVWTCHVFLLALRWVSPRDSTLVLWLFCISYDSSVFSCRTATALSLLFIVSLLACLSTYLTWMFGFLPFCFYMCMCVCVGLWANVCLLSVWFDDDDVFVHDLFFSGWKSLCNASPSCALMGLYYFVVRTIPNHFVLIFA